MGISLRNKTNGRLDTSGGSAGEKPVVDATAAVLRPLRSLTIYAPLPARRLCLTTHSSLCLHLQTALLLYMNLYFGVRFQEITVK